TTIWGVEAELSHSAWTEEIGGVVGPVTRLGAYSILVSQPFPPGLVSDNGPLAIPFEYTPQRRRQLTSLNGAMWVRQRLRTRGDLVYLGGIAFSRHRQDVTVSVVPLLRTLAQPATLHVRALDYSARPLVGLETRIAVANHLRAVPGVRVQGYDNGWAVRP